MNEYFSLMMGALYFKFNLNKSVMKTTVLILRNHL